MVSQETPTRLGEDPLPMDAIVRFTPTLHSRPNAIIRPENNTLSADFSVCVLGASRGIGAHIALAYAAASATYLTLTATSLRGLDDVTARVDAIAPQATVVPVACDVSRDAAMAALPGAICEKVPGARLDAVVVNAAYYGPKIILDITKDNPADFQKSMDVNVMGMYHAAHYLLPLLLATPDGARTFLAVSALAAWITSGPIAHAAYGASKMAQARLVETIAAQHGDKGLCAVSIHAGAVKTDMARAAAPPEFEKCDCSLAARRVRDIAWTRNMREECWRVADLVDEPGLCGAMCVWISKDRAAWLNGRFVLAGWDADELVGMKNRIVEKGLLKTRLTM